MKNIFVRSINIKFDSRINKFIDSMKFNEIEYKVLCWSRLKEDGGGDDLVSFTLPGVIGGRWKNIFGLIAWNIYVFYWLVRNYKAIKVVHAVDLDCIIPSYFFCRLFRKKIVFDVYDKYADAKSISGLLGWYLSKVENFFIKNSDISILVDECRIKQHGVEKKKNIYIIENIPLFKKNSFPFYKKEVSRKIIKIGYFGTLEKKHRGLEDVAQAVINSEKLFMEVAGYGELSDFFSSVAKKYPKKFKFYSALDSKSGLSLMKNVDIYIGFYYKTNPNHIWAAPNKYYEHLLLGVPLLTTFKTPPGDKVLEYETGWALHEGLSTIEDFFKAITQEEIMEVAKNAESLWDLKYSTYYQDVYINEYGKLIREIIE